MTSAPGQAIASWLALVLVSGCSDFETVGLLAPDAGHAAIDATAPTDAGTVTGTEPIAIDDCRASNDGGLDAGSIDVLMAGGDAGTLSWLYPYDNTVFPGGIGAPLLMWQSSAVADAVYVRQDGRERRAGVFRIEIDLSRDERIVTNKCSAEIQPPFHAQRRMRLNLLREQFREHNLLGEIFRPDNNGFPAALAASACDQQTNAKTHSSSEPIRISHDESERRN